MMARIDRSLLLAACSGGLLALSFPRPDFYPLAWVALVPLLLVMEKRPFATGFAAGLAFFAAVLYWLNIVMTTFGGLDPFSSLVAYLLLITYLALFFGAATWLAGRCKKRLGLPVLLSLPVIWVALEFLRGWLLTGFPWALIGYSQQNFSLAIQSADVTGVYGVGLVLVAVNALIAQLILQPKQLFSRWAVVGVALLLGSHFGYGVWRSGQLSDERPEQLQVALIQGNFEQSQKWDPALQQVTIDRYLSLSQQALLDHPDLLIWPEAATPFYLQEPSPLADQVHDLPKRSGVPLLVGTPAYQVAATGEYHYLNSAFLIGSDGLRRARSDKVHLVPFGEYVPLGPLLSFIDKLVVGVGDFVPGAIVSLPLGEHQLGVLVCYEVIFPYLARQHVQQGTDLLVNITNDAWFGRSSAPYQHLAMARFRAIENRIWLARSANTGISALMAPSGEVVLSGPIFETLQMTGKVGLGAVPTFYTRFGDLFAFACLLLTALLTLAQALVPRLRNKADVSGTQQTGSF
ncbi:MAG TPA: apolipoprotein N-acyltransferase [Pelovirga sp.]|nr:apolipoprotein N-acyltransferase [Pelovirga sp.]